MKYHVSFLTLSQKNARRKKISHLWFKSFLRQGLNFHLHHQDNHQKGKLKALLLFHNHLADDVQRHAEEQDKLLTTLDKADQPKQEEHTQTLEDENTFPSSGGGVPSSVVDQSFENLVSDRVDRVSEEIENEEHKSSESDDRSPSN